MNNLSVVIPVYNEAENIRTAVERIEAELRVPHRIVIVYDMDEDTTVPVVHEIQKIRDNVTLVKNKYGRGVLNAIKTGLEEASEAENGYVVVTMADLSDPPEVINAMYDIAERENADIVCASRYMKGGKQIGGPVIKGLMSRIAGLTLHRFARVATHDATNSFKLYSTGFLQKQRIESSGGFEIGIELVAKAHVQGAVIREVPTTWTDRVAGSSNFKLLSWLKNYLHWYFYAYKSVFDKYGKPFLKYVGAGFLCALLNWGTFYLLNYIAGLHYLAAAAIAFILSCTLNYVLCKFIFASRGRKKAAEFIFLLLASAIALSIDLSVMYLLVEKISLPRMVAKILGTGSAFFFNYISRQFFIFAPKQGEQ
jgi:glycosyltransferase involved in cell wall biosynthesis